MKKHIGITLILAISGLLHFVNWEQSCMAEDSVQAETGLTTSDAEGKTEKPVLKESNIKSESEGLKAIKQAEEGNKHLFLFVFEDDNEETYAAKQAFESAMNRLEDVAQQITIDKNNDSEKPLVDKFQLNGAPMPIVLAIAPNGAVTGAFYGDQLKDPQLQDSIAGPTEQKCAKALQDRKLVFLCLQNASTKSNEAALQGVKEFKADARFAEFTEVLQIDPTGKDNQSFMTKLKLDPKMAEATTVFLVPPSVIVSKVTGATDKDALIKSLMSATSGACGAGGCGPKGCAPAK